MEPINKHEGVAAILDRANVDTDQIIPKQFLKQTSREGFGKNLFYDWRYLDDGADNPDFELNQPAFENASILVAGDNFGCGSSREHAAWAVLDYGFRVVVSTSFADIFFNNSAKNGILLITVSTDHLTKLMDEIRQNPGVRFAVDLENQNLKTPGGLAIDFEIDPFRKECLIKGLDDIAWTLQYQSEIESFETGQKKNQPWLW